MSPDLLPPQRAAEHAAQGRQATILVVDDEEDIRESLQLLLEEEVPGARVVLAPDAAAALKLLATQHIDVVLSDYRMPGMDGLAFLIEVHRRYPTLPAIMMTAFPDARLAQAAVEQGGVRDFMAKPLDLERTIGAVRAALA